MQGDDKSFVDASPALADVHTDGAWRTVLLSAEGNGGDTIFCLDVTNPYAPKIHVGICRSAPVPVALLALGGPDRPNLP